jgi:hypothetical protein
MRSGRLPRRTGAKFLAARVPLGVGLLGLSMGAAPLVALILAALVGVGAALGYRLAVSSI